MKFNIIALAVPLFIFFILLEFLIARKKKLDYFNLHNSIANISIGIAERLMDVFVAGLFYYVYEYLQQHFALFKIHANVATWILLLVCTDFVWYWYHRFAHEWNIFWAVHVVHHQSEDFNYTVSARITVLQAVVRTGFWCALPIIGFPAGMITSILIIHGLYPFFIHTRVIGKLGFLEYILVTPSHHRVHHASNEKYLDKNYGDVLIIWDKLFGTFQAEEEEPQYGLTKPLKSFSFLWQHFHFFIELWLSVKKEKGFFNKIKLLFKKPDVIDPENREIAEDIFNIIHSEAPVDKPLNKYVVWQMILITVLLFLFMGFDNYVTEFYQVIITGVIIITLVNCGAIMEQKKWIFYLEFARLLLVALGCSMIYPNPWLLIAVVTIATLVICWFYSIENRYLQWVYPSRNST
ncbi:sterol desaturase family protein [Pinibacter soli]|uniref:Sterol desaturase family protein n=1 Tax=Pinibacter soli TaxID=3044211 RepID=A0ABT6RCM5_9BACT|nr:sterol desaturase family protein [Pinibacter soli]MDI3319622.1 sterol desaturase family protein [Pinibacter soli]